MLFRTLTSIFVATILAGCALPPPIKKSEPITSQAPVATLVIPAPESSGGSVPSNPEDLARNVLFENYGGIYDNRPPPSFKSLQWKIQGNNFTVENEEGYISGGRPVTQESASYDGTLGMTKSGSNYQLTFSITKRNYYAQPSSDGTVHKLIVLSDPSDVFINLSKAELPWKSEFDSEFNTDSTYANFTRLTRKEVYKQGTKDPVTGKIFKERFWVRVSGREIPVNVETYPYRNGSKVVIYARLPGALSGSTIDFANSADALRKEIERIVRS